MPYKSDAIANFFIAHDGAAEAKLTPMKLQKLVYFSHGWHLATTDLPLIEEPVQAWQYGPVIVSLYHALKAHQNTPVTNPIQTFDWVRENGKPVEPLRISSKVRTISDHPDEMEFSEALLERMWKVYGHHSAIQLSKMTHEEGSPWDQVSKKFPGTLPQGLEIPNELIREYFAQKRAENLAKSAKA